MLFPDIHQKIFIWSIAIICIIKDGYHIKRYLIEIIDEHSLLKTFWLFKVTIIRYVGYDDFFKEGCNTIKKTCIIYKTYNGALEMAILIETGF